MERSLGLGGRIPLAINLALTTGNEKCNRSLKKTTSPLVIPKYISGLTLREKD
jgi:hypothetical protein